ncbi:MAG: DUF4252 domain-containing protein [Chitinophagaceae bacterium]
MKYKIITALLLVFTLSACNRGYRDWRNFRQKYASNGATIRLNGLMKLAASAIISKSTDDPEAEAIMHILNNMKGIEINIIPQSKAHYTVSEVDKLSRLLNHGSYESLINIQKGNKLINLWARGNQNEFSDPLALINDGNDVIMVEMKGTLSTKDIQTIVNAGMKYTDSDDEAVR